jgi:hypothetical protein
MVITYETTRWKNPEDHNLVIHIRENLQSQTYFSFAATANAAIEHCPSAPHILTTIYFF